MITDQPDLFSDPPTLGHTDGGTSKEAATAMRQSAAVLRERVLRLFEKKLFLTADECAHQLGASVLSVRPRVTELKKAGRLRKTRLRKTNTSGMSAAVYVFTGSPR